jgi:aminopeptidase N
LSANAQELAPDYNNFFVTIPASALRAGANTLTLRFTRPYSDDGSGLYRFIDPEDGRVYLYTDFEPYDQNRLFPSFDQPDLKARYTTTVTAPAGWHVIANTLESGTETFGGERVWLFPETLPISTYVYALHAGDYHVWESTAGDIPLRLFAREALVDFVYPEHWFLPTQQGFAFYQGYFETPYPFGKYDQIIVPHFNAGAMENVAAVTFSERYLRRGTVTRQNRRAITSVILHEMAHMWFGDLVTMDWWNGLWLNESFATVMAVIAMTEATEFDDEWQESFRDTTRAYQADERDTTHPIELPIPDTDSAFANFDRITYEKGSATLVQLMHLVGPENFRRGVARYLAAHSYKNTKIGDFLGAISSAADRNLSDWASDWLLEPGTNSVEVEFSCRNGSITELTIVQTAPARWPTLRTHRTQLGLYRFSGGNAVIETLPVTYSGARTAVPAATGLPCPDMVYANHGDWDYSRVRLSPDTMTMLDRNIASLADPLTRLMLWQSIWDAVLDGRMPVTDYIDFAINNIDAESNEAAIRQALAALNSSAQLLEEILPDDQLKTDTRRRLENYAWSKAGAETAGSDLQLLYYDSYVGFAATPDAIKNIASLLTEAARPPEGINLDQDRRWALLSVLSAAGFPDAGDLLIAERARDRSDEGLRRAQSIAAGRPDQALKKQLIESLIDPDGVQNLADFRAIARGLYARGQHSYQLENAALVLDGLQSLNANRDAEFISSYVGGLLGAACSVQYRAQLEATINGSDDLHPLIRRGLLDSRYETDRCLRIAARQQTVL